tara:strand:- start:53 stop:241 length:189 start_codon:yes stop_codon:yes gene_type:complete
LNFGIIDNSLENNYSINIRLIRLIFMGFVEELWNSQTNTFLGLGLAVIVLFRIYIKFLDIYQ